jgi:hypothetical protein
VVNSIAISIPEALCFFGNEQHPLSACFASGFGCFAVIQASLKAIKEQRTKYQLPAYTSTVHYISLASALS